MSSRQLADSLLAAARPGHVEQEAWLLTLVCYAAGRWPDIGQIGHALGEPGWANPDKTPPGPDTIRQTSRLLDTVAGDLARYGSTYRRPADMPVPVPVRRFAYDALTRSEGQDRP